VVVSAGNNVASELADPNPAEEEVEALAEEAGENGICHDQFPIVFDLDSNKTIMHEHAQSGCTTKNGLPMCSLESNNMKTLT
jgi:hypothetical protein